MKANRRLPVGTVIAFAAFLCCQTIAQPIRLSAPSNLFTTNTTISSYGVVGDLQVLLWGTNITSLNTTVATARVGRSSSALFTFTSTPLTGPGFYRALGSNTWTAPPIPGEDVGLRILSLPEDQIALTNTEAMFVVQAVAINTNLPIIYQWRKNEDVIPSATNFFLHLTNVQTNVDVAFYSCDVQAGTNAPYRARNKEADAPGARLYVYSGTNTPVTGPYQPAPAGAALSSASCGTWNYVGWVPCKNPETWSRFYGTTYFDKPSWANSCTVTDLTVGNLASFGYTSRIYGIETSARPPFCGTSNTTITVNPANPPYSYLYQFTVYITSTGTSGLSLGSPITYDVKWQTLPPP